MTLCVTPLDVTSREAHFEFGANWRDFAAHLDEARILSSCDGVARLLGRDLRGATFLDVGCGSGLHALAALRLGAGRVVAVDLDENSVSTTRAVLEAHAPDGSWDVQQCSVFDLDPATFGRFDIVYSWGVLHHTGAMYRAIQSAARMTADGGALALAIYNRTRLCGFWKREKRFYTHASPFVQRAVRAAFMAAFLAYLPATDFNPVGFVRRRSGERGMRWANDVHDWLGGHPYESASPEEIERFVRSLGFHAENVFAVGPQLGLWGSGCNEFVFRRDDTQPESSRS